MSAFQSTPPVSGRRCLWAVVMDQLHDSFNPRPPFPGGDATPPKLSAEFYEVSIHAPRFREAMPASARRYDSPSMFQSTPPVSGRRCHETHFAQVVVHDVSIHAPRFREAMRLSRVVRLTASLFQSTPPVSGRRCVGVIVKTP